MTIKEVSEKYNISSDTLRYYEHVGAIPPVTRTAAGTRDYRETDIAWVKLAMCLRAAGCTVDVLVKYRKLNEMGDVTIPDRLKLLTKQREELTERRRQLDETIDVLNYKISTYETAVKTGKLEWTERKKKT
ncbi:MAG: MerR family transcriptional regulator [Firmicutes bacterium]|nr:MerR family transcriptional regulator [Bacillota bacterium]